MPLETDYLLPLPKANISVALEPVPNILYSFYILTPEEELSGIGEWVARTAAALPPERLHINRLVFNGMYFALQPEQRWLNFPDYLDDLAALPAETLPERLIKNYLAHTQVAGPAPTMTEVLASADAYLAFLRERFPPEAIDVAIETETYHLVLEPRRMQGLIVSHLREMWRIFAPEWERVKPMLQESVHAFQQLDLGRMNVLEAARLITGRDLSGKWEKLIAESEQVIFVPSAHIGPYLFKFLNSKMLWILFGARLPAGARSGSALNRSELLVRLGALNDDIRLQILWLLSQNEELCAQDIMNRLDLSQSAASRHLRQLSATGYLTERRRSGEKCYAVNHDRIQETFGALEQFLSQSLRD
jgi:DNA-binding transcriptional ArsR family regulator